MIRTGMPWKDPNDRRAKRATRRAEIRGNERAWYQLNAERLRTKRRAQAAAKRKDRPPKPPPDLEKRREKMRAKGRKQRQNPAYRVKASLRSKEWRVGNPEKMRTNNKAAKLRAVAEQEILAGRERPAVCDICGRSDRIINFDHDHQRGHFRGWICNQDNMALGLVKDDVGVLRKMIAYLERHRTNTSPQLALPGV
jgi:hypothetical protein